MDFDPTSYGIAAQSLLATAGYPDRRMPLVIGKCTAPKVRAQLKDKNGYDIFPKARHPQAALSGLLLYIGCFDASHAIAQEIKDADGSYWHAILHRQEPDAFNSGYWFNRVGRHAVYSLLADEARLLGYPAQGKWDPEGFIRYASDSDNAKIALEVQHAEWQLLFHHCAQEK